jgi:hypothetical protein
MSTDGSTAFKLTQKLPGWRGDARGLALTTIYLDEPAYLELHAALNDRGYALRKVRHQPRGLGGLSIDVFEGALRGLVMAEIEFDDAERMSAYAPPEWCGDEVTQNPSYSGFILARDGRASRAAQ